MSWETKPLLLKNGLPIPQQFDPALDAWVEYDNVDVKALKTDLALVKTELQTVKANQTSGDQKVQLSGAEAVVIKEHVLTNQTSPCFVGKNGPTTYSLIEPLDVRQYTKRFVRVRNSKDVSIDVNLSMGPLLKGEGSRWYVSPVISIPARSFLYMDASLVPQLETIPYNGMFVSVRNQSMPPEGDIIIMFVGG